MDDAAEQHANDIGDDRRRHADGESLETRAPPRGRRPPAPERADGKEGDSGHQGRGLDRGGKSQDEWRKRDRAADDKGEEGGERGSRRGAVDRWQTVLLGHHCLDPAPLFLGDDADGILQRLALEALGLEDLANFLTLSFGRYFDVALLHVAHMLIFFDLGPGAQIIRGRHGEAVGEDIGHAKNEQGFGGKRRSDHAGDHGEGGYRAVDAAINPIAQVTYPRSLLEPLGDFARVMAVLEMPGVHDSAPPMPGLCGMGGEGEQRP